MADNRHLDSGVNATTNPCTRRKHLLLSFSNWDHRCEAKLTAAGTHIVALTILTVRRLFVGMENRGEASITNRRRTRADVRR